MLKTIFNILLGLLLLSQVSCSVQPFQVVIADKSTLENRTNTTQIPPDKSEYPKNILEVNRNCVSHTDKDTNQLTHCRVKYYSSYGNRWSVVKGVLRNGRTYPVILDTGASADIFINDVHIQENNLAFHPSKNNGKPANWGICDLDELLIGEMSLVGWPCYYQQQHVEVRLFGLPVYKDKAIIVGLPVLRQFKYIKFDNIKKEVYFSLDNIFESHKSDLWTYYPFVMEEDSSGNTFLFVNISITGEQAKLQLDTGSSGGLTVDTELWGNISRKIQDVTLANGKDLYPYIAKFSCRQGIIPKIKVGNRTVENVKLSVFPNDSPIIENCQGLLGMQCFQDTVMVLDFEKGLMWVNSMDDSQT